MDATRTEMLNQMLQDMPILNFIRTNQDHVHEAEVLHFETLKVIRQSNRSCENRSLWGEKTRNSFKYLLFLIGKKIPAFSL